MFVENTFRPATETAVVRTECTTNALPFQAAGRRVGRRAVLARFDGGTLTTEASLVRQRVYGLALGYEDLNDHKRLRHDPLRALLAEVDDLTAPLAASVRSTVSVQLGRVGSTVSS